MVLTARKEENKIEYRLSIIPIGFHELCHRLLIKATSEKNDRTPTVVESSMQKRYTRGYVDLIYHIYPFKVHVTRSIIEMLLQLNNFIQGRQMWP